MICQFYFDYFYITSSKRQSQRLISLELFVNEKNLDEADVLAKIVGSVHSGVRNLSILPPSKDRDKARTLPGRSGSNLVPL